MQSTSSNAFLDYFKLFKVFELKKIEKTGLVKVVQDKTLNRKILSVEGNISTSNFVALQTHNFPNVPFSERYLYLQCFVEAGKSFCLQVAYSLGNKPFKAVYSSLYKSPKKHLENIVHLPLNLPASRWTIAVIDLYELGLHFGFKAQEIKMIFRVSSLEIRASSKVKGIFQSDYFYSLEKMPKDFAFPLKKEENFFDRYHYFVETTDPACLKDATSFKEVIEKEMEMKKMMPKEEKSQSREKLKESKSIETAKPLSKSRNSLEKGKSQDKPQEKSQKSLQNNMKKPSNPQLPPMNTRKKEPTKNLPKEEEVEDNDVEEQQIEPPKPQGMITVSLSCIEGFTLNTGNLMSVESYLSKPNYLPVHKPIQILASCDENNIRVVTAYNDGSICLWDTIRRTPLSYFMTELSELKIILVDSKLNLILIGLDKLKREVINIVSEGSVVFRQISTFNITGALLVSNKAFEYGLVSFGFENIRLWRINNEKSIIQGVNIYLGQTNRKVKYTAGIVLPTKEDFLVYVADSNGFITTISIAESKMLQSVKLDSCSIDQLLLLLDGRAITSNEMGVIKVIDLQRMEVQQEYSLNNRIKEMRQLPSEEIVMTHYNKSIGLLNLENSMYSFLMRAHTSTINRITYNPLVNKVVTISKDNSIRIWQYVAHSNGPFQFRLQEQYEFVITGEEMVDLASGLEGRQEDLLRVIVGGDSGKLRVINIEKYSIEQQIIIQTGPMALSMSRNGKYVLCSYFSGNSYLLDSNLTILFKYLHSNGQKKKMRAWHNGFNRINKEYYIENIEDDCLEFYALKEQTAPLFTIRFNEKTPAEVSFIGSRVFICNGSELKLYEKGTMMQILNLHPNSMSNPSSKSFCFSFDYPLLCYSSGEKLTVKVLNAHLQEELQLPEPLNNIKIHYNSQRQDGMIICSGKNSHSLYVFAFQLHNVTDAISYINLEPVQEEHQEDNDLEISFSNKTTVSHYVNKIKEDAHPRNNQLEEAPKELRKLYQQEQELYEEVKQYLFPKSFQDMPNSEKQEHLQEQRQDFREEHNPKELSVMLNFGYQLRQFSKDDNDIGRFHWLSENNSLILLTGCGKSIMQHFFSVPIKHKIVSFPSSITSLCISQRSYQGLRYLSVCLNGFVKLYNIFQQLSLIRSIDTISSTFNGCVIFQSCITNCNRYLLTLSFNNISFDNKLYIHVIEISTGNAVSSSYLSLPSPKNKYKGMQIKDAKEYRMLINPFKNSLEFVVFNSQGLLYFYRVTSIFTLQTMQLEELASLCRDKISNISCACFISVGESSFEDAVLAVGTENGSLVFVDCRTASIMIACIGVLPSPISSISYSKSHDEEHEKLILFTNSTLVTVFNLLQGLNSILISMEQSKQQPSSSEIKRVMTLDGEVTAKSNVESNGQQIVITKVGSLWLLDYQDFVTVKVSSMHTLPINQAEVLVSDSKEAFLLTCSDDGCAKLSNLSNLEQIFEVYKPRKQAKSFSTSGNLTLISFSQQVYIYNKLDPNIINEDSEFASLGSFKLDSPIVSIEHIPSTDNYYILTESEVIIIYVAIRVNRNTKRSEVSVRGSSALSSESRPQSKNMEVNVEIRKITDIQNPHLLVANSVHSPYDQFALLSRPGKVTVWTRKCLKRNYNPVDELSNVHDLSYYLIDAHSNSSVDTSYVRFLSQNDYLWGLFQEGLVQIRNYRQHSTLRQINLSCERISAMSCLGEEQLTFYVGDESGYLYIINENGLLLEKTRALECKITGISPWRSGPASKLLVYGSKYAVTLNSIDLF